MLIRSSRKAKQELEVLESNLFEFAKIVILDTGVLKVTLAYWSELDNEYGL